MDAFYHEALYWTGEALARLREFAVTICGAGALGANVAESLARGGVAQLKIIDHDCVEERNLSTQPWQRADVGTRKARLLANLLYRAVGARVEVETATLTADNAGQLLKGSQLVIDTFDNSAGRGAVAASCGRTETPCLHAGLSAEYGEVIWNESYRVPSGAGEDICDYPLARNLAMLAAIVAAESAIRFILNGSRESYTITLRDLEVKPFNE